MARISSTLGLFALLPFFANARTIKFGTKVRLTPTIFHDRTIIHGVNSV
jgi:hypothetical protein